MIKLIEDYSVKLPCYTSIFFQINYIDKNIFNILIQTSNINYNNITRTFEFPLNKLAYLINILSKVDDVEIIPLKLDNSYIKLDNYNFKIKPFQHQIEAVEYGLNHKKWLLLDDQGLGKTGSIIYLNEILKKYQNIKHCLIICGINSLKYNWAHEIKQFSDFSYRILGQKISKKGKISYKSISERCKELQEGISEFFVIVNSEILQHKEFIDAFKKSKTKFDMIVVDEIHKSGGINSKAGKNLLKLKAEYKIGLTGTLVTKNLDIAYLALKWTENIPSNFTDFKRMYYTFGGFNNVQITGTQNIDLLKNVLQQCSLRRLKTDVIDLPEKIYKTEFVEMDKEQQDLYLEVQDGIFKELDKLDHVPTVLEEITINMRLRQITAYPGILSTTVTKSAKLERLEELVDMYTAEGDKVVIFNSFVEAAKAEFNILNEYNPLLCTGEQNDETIEYNKELFKNNNDNKVLICTWQKMGTGHTLVSANYAIFVDTPWTAGDFQQTVDRIYRIGQLKTTFIVKLIAVGTYDERVEELINEGYILSNNLLN